MLRKVVLLLAFAGYCAVVFIGAAVHEPWWDEAQAWLIARDAPVPDLFTHELRYEGHPPLWYVLLAVPAKLGLPFGALKVVAALAGIAGVALLLFRCRSVPLLLRLVVPFSFFIAYQYTVVARSYVLFLPLLIGIALIYERRAEHFALFVALLILLANVSVHGATISCAIAAVTAIDVWRGRLMIARRSLVIGAIAFALNLAMLAAVLWPPHDITSASGLHPVFSPMRYAEVIRDLFPALFWGSDLTGAILAIIGSAILLIWFATRGTALLYLATLAAALFVAARYYSNWHEGIFFFLLLFVSVITFARASAAPRLLDTVAMLVLLLVVARHVQWTASSLRYDMQYEFTGSERAAEFIADHRLDRLRIFGAGVRAMELQPYFEKNLYANYPMRGAFWDWSSRNPWPYAAGANFTPQRAREFYDGLLAGRPDLIVAAVGFREDSVYAAALRHEPNYALIGTFPGRRYWKDRQTELILFELFARKPSPR